MKIIVGLGNPGDEYEHSRHNVGRDFLDYIAEKHEIGDWKFDVKMNAYVTKGTIEGESVMCVKPETFMNNSGQSLVPLKLTAKKIEDVIVAYDDLDLPLGKIKLSFARSSGGHNGVDSIIKTLKSEKFARIRIGVSPTTTKGVAKKPTGEEKVVRFLMSVPKPEERKVFTKVFKQSLLALETMIRDGRHRAMSFYN